MSWLKSAMNKALEAGNKSNITRSVKNYADSVVHHAGQAVAEGAKIFQDRSGTQNLKNLNVTVRRLEEAAVNCRGLERTELLKRWLVVLTEIDEVSESTDDEKEQNLKKVRETKVLYHDPDNLVDPMNFHDAFLHSQALEGITLSMILREPNDDEMALLLDMFEICLAGRKEVHNAIVSSIQDLANAFSRYEDEVLAKREELLQFAQTSITGLKINSGISRIDAKVFELKKELEGMSIFSTTGGVEEKKDIFTVEELKAALSYIRVCSKLEKLLLKKKMLSSGESPELHAQKVEKLKVLLESLASSSLKAERRISDNRVQKEEALKFRATKASEIMEMEKDMLDEIGRLERRKDELEAELKMVNTSLASARTRLHNIEEEGDQFVAASDDIVTHFESKEEELSKSVALSNLESEVLKTWINFLEDTWVLRCSYSEENSNQIKEELEGHHSFFVSFAIDLLSAYVDVLGSSIGRIGKYVENLKSLREGECLAPCFDQDDSGSLNPLKNLEEEYLSFEEKIITTFAVVASLKEQFNEQETFKSSQDLKTEELFENLEKLRLEFEAIERPNLDRENPLLKHETPRTEATLHVKRDSVSGISDLHDGVEAHTVESLDPEEEMVKLESEFGKISRDYSAEEISGWEFDELEKELQAGSSRTGD